MRAPLRFQELLAEVEHWCQEHGADCTTESTDTDDEVPAFTAKLGDGRGMHFKLVKGWPPIIEVRRDDFPDDERALRLLRVNNDNSWNPPLPKLLEPWANAQPYDAIHAPLRYQELEREVKAWCEQHGTEPELRYTDPNTGTADIVVRMPDDEHRELTFRMLKAWPLSIEVVRNDMDAPADRTRLLHVDPHADTWTPPLHTLLDPWKSGRPFEA